MFVNFSHFSSFFLEMNTSILGEMVNSKLRRLLVNHEISSQIHYPQSQSFAVFHKTLKNSRISQEPKSKLHHPKWDKEIWKQLKTTLLVQKPKTTCVSDKNKQKSSK